MNTEEINKLLNKFSDKLEELNPKTLLMFKSNDKHILLNLDQLTEEEIEDINIVKAFVEAAALATNTILPVGEYCIVDYYLHRLGIDNVKKFHKKTEVSYLALLNHLSNKN